MDFLKNVKNYKEQLEDKMKIENPTQINLGNKDSKQGTMSIVNISLPSERIINQ